MQEITLHEKGVEQKKREALIPFNKDYEYALTFQMSPEYLDQLADSVDSFTDLEPSLSLLPWVELSNLEISQLTSAIVKKLHNDVPNTVAHLFQSLLLFSNRHQIEPSAFLRDYFYSAKTNTFLAGFMNAYLKKAARLKDANFNLDLLSLIISLMSRKDAVQYIDLLSKNAKQYPKFRNIYLTLIEHVSAYMMHYAANYSQAIFYYYLDSNLPVDIVAEPLRQAVQRYDRYMHDQDPNQPFSYQKDGKMCKIRSIWNPDIEGGLLMKEIKQMTPGY